MRARERDSKRSYSLEHDGAHGPEGEADVKPIITINGDICEYLNTPTIRMLCVWLRGNQGRKGSGQEEQSGQSTEQSSCRERGLKRRLEAKALVERLPCTCTSGTLLRRRTFASQGTPAWAFSPPTPSSNTALQKTFSPCVSTNP